MYQFNFHNPSFYVVLFMYYVEMCLLQENSTEWSVCTCSIGPTSTCGALLFSVGRRQPYDHTKWILQWWKPSRCYWRTSAWEKAFHRIWAEATVASRFRRTKVCKALYFSIAIECLQDITGNTQLKLLFRQWLVIDTFIMLYTSGPQCGARRCHGTR